MRIRGCQGCAAIGLKFKSMPFHGICMILEAKDSLCTDVHEFHLPLFHFCALLAFLGHAGNSAGVLEMTLAGARFLEALPLEKRCSMTSSSCLGQVLTRHLPCHICLVTSALSHNLSLCLSYLLTKAAETKLVD